MQKKKGISLVALSITIIVMIILASVVIMNISNTDIFDYANQAVDSVEVSNEKDIIEQARILVYGKNVGPILTAEKFNEALNRVAGEGTAQAIDNEDTIVVEFTESRRLYELDYYGKIQGPIIIGKDEYAGDLSKGGEYTGTVDKPYVIRCIEDLVELSRNYTTYQSSYVILERSLDFKEIASYNDFATTEYGDLNGDGTLEGIKTELTKTAEGCIGFTPIESFAGNFNGQTNTISNLYQYQSASSVGLFKNSSGTIENLGLINITLTGTTNIGGIAAYSSGIIQNCYVDGISAITGTGNIGLICGQSAKTISRCYSKGELKLDSTSGYFGGIVGHRLGGTIEKSYNIMDMTAGCTMGGIIGQSYGNVSVEECYHIGDIISKNDSNVAGIVGYCSWAPSITNCYSVGKISGRWSSGIASYTGANVFNCYSIGEIKSSYAGGIIQGMNYGRHMVHCFGRRGDRDSYTSDIVLTESQIVSILSSYNNTNGYGHGANAVIGYECNVLFDDYLKTQEFVDELNRLIVADGSGVITETEQNVWKMDTEGINNGYPIFVWQ